MRGALARRDITTAYSTPAEARGVSAACCGVDWAVPVRDFRDHPGAGDLVRPGVYCEGLGVPRGWLGLAYILAPDLDDEAERPGVWARPGHGR
jgi:hypothetical protein